MSPLVYSDALLRRVLSECKVIAVVGASPKPSRPSHGVMRFLLASGYRVIPVNPGQAGETILDQPCYATLADIPEPVDMIDIFREASAVPGIVEAALALAPRPKAIWMQLAIRDDAAAARAEAAGLTVIMDRCPAIEIPRLSR
jgi:predicted CoA-binding protein